MSLERSATSISRRARLVSRQHPSRRPAPTPAEGPAPPDLTRADSNPGGLGIDVVPVVVAIDLAALSAAQFVVSLSATSMLLFATLVLVLNFLGGHYKARAAPSVLDELPRLAGQALVAGAITAALRAYLSWPVQDGPVHAAVMFLVFASAARAIGYPLIRRQRRGRQVGKPTVIVGCGQVGNQLAAALLDHPEYGMRPCGYIDDNPLMPDAERKLPLLGGLQSLTHILTKYRIQNVIVAFTTNREYELVETLRGCHRLKCEIFFVPRLYELHGAAPGNELIWGLPLTRLTRASYRTVTWRTKRIFDIVVASVGLAVLSPLLAACALAVRMEGGPGVIFRQERVGLDGRLFQILKFRTLKPTGEAESEMRWTIAGDPRVGPVGKMLRRLSLDELPQLWNVVRGDMSMVGPRPERPFFVDEFTLRFPWYVARHRVPVGLTGWAQVNGLRGDTDISDRARFDNYYIENWSMWTDIKILVRTAGQVVGGMGR